MRESSNTIHNLRILKEIAETLNRGVGLRETLETTLPLVVELLGLHTGWLFLLDENEHFYLAAYHDLPPALAYPGSSWRGRCTCQAMAKSGELLPNAQIVECSRLHETTGDRHGLAYHASVPLVKGDRLIGILNVATSQWDSFTPQALQIFSAVGFQLATAIERTRLAEQATHIALVEERNRLAREVHDTLAQGLAGIALQLEAADALLDTAPERARSRILQALNYTRESLAEARRSVLDLRAGPLEREALPEALTTLAQRFSSESGVAAELQLALEGARLPARSEAALYRIAQEALANIRQHADASHVLVELFQADGQVILVISDNGRGFAGCEEPHSRSDGHGFGLIGMRERAHLLDGTLTVSCAPGAGTQVRVQIPLRG